ncbi:MAG: TIGR04282 family arsenosugar biosynthesis glycosyltransferase [OM182 bacterium]|nr:TIGR04282 family arsenosugar biosynthesis glycosyltransferase [OM182 bacterium]
MKYPNAQILIFAKQPIPGEVKTRLIPAIGVTSATDLHCAMTRRVAAMLSASALAPFRFAVSGDMSDPLFAESDGCLPPTTQIGEDLGERMLNAATRAFEVKQKPSEATVEYVVIVGADCPALAPIHVQETLESLASGIEVVFVPADDGGYVLVGMSRVFAEMFQDIAWGTSEVLQVSLNKLSKRGVSTRCLSPLWDVDTEEDLLKLARLEQPLEW